MKNVQDINRQIEGLNRMKLTLPPKSIFGDDNYGKIDAQIAVLKNEKTPDDFYIDEGLEEYCDGDDDIYYAADDAERWLNGDTTEDLFE